MNINYVGVYKVYGRIASIEQYAPLHWVEKLY
jgi:hypothetical protein